MTDTPRMVIVPAKVTKAMVAAWDNSKPINGKYRSAHCAQGELTAMTAASPNAGKIRREDLERAMDEAEHAQGCSVGAFGPHSRDEDSVVYTELRLIWQDAFCAALGLEIAEGGENG